MLADLLQDAAFAYEATDHSQAIRVAEKIRNITVLEHWQNEGQGPDKLSLLKALAAKDCHSSAKLLAQIADQLVWHDSNSLRQRPDEFSGNYHFTAIIGPGSLIENEEIRFGVYLQESNTIYPSHRHEAVELYLPISGAALWQKDDSPFEKVKSGTLIHHLSYQPHATTTEGTPMLAFWAWLGNLSLETYSYVTE